jgi:hypothetical protein
MPKKAVLLVYLFLFQLSFAAIAASVDLTGTWKTKYSFGPIEQSTTANIQQVKDNLVGSYTVNPSSESEGSGIIFGTVDGDEVLANFLAVEGSLMKIALVDLRIEDENTLKGSYNYVDTQNKVITGNFEAIRL